VTGEVEHAEAASQAAARFCSDHLARLAAPLAGLLSESGIEHLVKASQRLAAQAGAPPTRRWLPVLQESTDDDGLDFCCGDL